MKKFVRISLALLTVVLMVFGIFYALLVAGVHGEQEFHYTHDFVPMYMLEERREKGKWPNDMSNFVIWANMKRIQNEHGVGFLYEEQAAFHRENFDRIIIDGQSSEKIDYTIYLKSGHKLQWHKDISDRD